MGLWPEGVGCPEGFLGSWEGAGGGEAFARLGAEASALGVPASPARPCALGPVCTSAVLV